MYVTSRGQFLESWVVLLGELWLLSPSFVALHPLDLPRMFMLYWASGIPANSYIAPSTSHVKVHS